MIWLNWSVGRTGRSLDRPWHRLYIPRRKPKWVPNGWVCFGETFADDVNELFQKSRWTPFVRFDRD